MLIRNAVVKAGLLVLFVDGVEKGLPMGNRGAPPRARELPNRRGPLEWFWPALRLGEGVMIPTT